MFSALRQGSPLYILDKGENPSIKIGLVESVTSPRPEYGNITVPYGGLNTLVDITVKVGNDKKQYVGIPSNLSIHGSGDIVISESRDAMMAEVEGMLLTSKSIVDSIDYHKKMIVACEDMLKQLNPAFAKEQERDGAIDSLKSEVATLRQEISKMTTLLANRAVTPNTTVI